MGVDLAAEDGVVELFENLCRPELKLCFEVVSKFCQVFSRHLDIFSRMISLGLHAFETGLFAVLLANEVYLSARVLFALELDFLGLRLLLFFLFLLLRLLLVLRLLHPQV